MFFAATASAQGFLTVQGKNIVNGAGQPVLLRGMGLGGWMLQEPYMMQLSGVATAQHEIKQKIVNLVGEEKTASFYAAWLANHCQKGDIDSLAAWGFNSVRLPMHFGLYTLPVEKEPVRGENTWIEKGFDLTDSLLSWCAANKMYLILDLHAAPGGQGNDLAISDRDTTNPSLWQSDQNRQKTIALWKKLAQRYKNEEWIGGYDLINEPNWGFQKEEDKNGCAETENVPLKSLLTEITAAIREVDKTHIIFIEGNCWGNNYAGMLPVSDKNTVLSFHKYWNYNTTESIKGFLELREKYNMPIWMGESGENSNTWFTEAISLFEKNNIGWAWWPLKKLGVNNPLQVPVNKQYQQLLNYWKGTGAKPSAEEAFAGLMQLANDVKVENNIVQKDVVNSLINQEANGATELFAPNIIKNGAVVFAANYDLGKNGAAYFDTDTANYRISTGVNVVWNKGKSYRNDGVDIDTCSDIITNRFSVTNTEEGEWLQYTVKPLKKGTYTIGLRTLANKAAGEVLLWVNGKNVRGKIPLKKGSLAQWQTTEVKGISLQEGNNIIRVKVSTGGFHFNYLLFTQETNN